MPSIYPLPFLLLAVLLLAGESSSQPASGDQATLLAIKKQWGNPWQLVSWDPVANADHCNWTGVVCGGGRSGAVTGISLPKLNLTGKVPESLCDTSRKTPFVSVDKGYLSRLLNRN